MSYMNNQALATNVYRNSRHHDGPSRRINSQDPRQQSSLKPMQMPSYSGFSKNGNRPSQINQKANGQNLTASQQNFMKLPGKQSYLLGTPKPNQTSHSFNGFRGGNQALATSAATDQYESRLLSKYLNPPQMPSTANYQQIKIMARTGEGRGPFVGSKNGSSYPAGASPVYGAGSMKRRKKQQQSGGERRALPPRGAYQHPQISYKNQNDIMKSIFGNKNLPPTKQNHNQYGQKKKTRGSSQAAHAQLAPSPPSKSNLMGSHIERSHMELPKEVPEDELEKAIFDLQDVKNTYMNEQKEFEEKQKTGFKTQEGFFQGNDVSTPSTKQNNFFGRPQTQGGDAKFKPRHIEGDLINDPNNNLHGEMDQLSKEELKERLIVAEKVMKTLFQRNKELEEKFQNEQKTTATTSNFDAKEQVLNCSTCQQNAEKLKSLTLENDDLKQKVKELEVKIKRLPETPKNDKGVPQNYKDMMELRLEETMAEAKRHYQSYVDMRSQYNQFIESRMNLIIDHCVNGDKQAGTPQVNSIKSNKVKADMIQTLKVNLEAQEQMLNQEIQNQKLSYEKILNKINQKDEIIQKNKAKVQSLQEEIDRRKFVESKVQTYVKTLCQQNERLKQFIQDEIPEKAKQFLHELQIGPSTENNSNESEEEEQNDEESQEEI